jgi:hypothetical protein
MTYSQRGRVSALPLWTMAAAKQPAGGALTLAGLLI